MAAVRVLIVENEALVALDLSARLSALGYAVVGTAASGAEALRLVRGLRPDIMLMDIGLDGRQDGIEVVASLSAEDRVPVIYLTGFQDEQQLARARATRPHGFLTKPFSTWELHAAIQMAVEREATEQTLEQFEQRLVIALDALAVSSWELNASDRTLRRLVYRNDRYAPPDLGEVRGWDSFLASTHPADHPRILAALERAFASQGRYEVEFRKLEGSGVRWLRAAGRVIPAKSAGSDRLVAVVQDITQSREVNAALEQRSRALQSEIAHRHITEAELRQSREEFRYLFRNNPLPMWIISRSDHRLLEVNAAAAANYGYAEAEMTGLRLDALMADAEPGALLASLAAAQPSHQTHANCRHRRRDGQVIQVDLFSHALNFDGEPARLMVAQDVTARNVAEEQLRQAQKMQAIGQLTGGVAHDFNNLLSIILGNLELVQERTTADPVIQEMISDALKSVRRGARLTQQLLAFSRQQPLKPQTVEIGHLVSEMSDLLRRALGETVKIEKIIPDSLWKVRVDPNQLENALLNLAVNARDAMPGGGVLTIEAVNKRLDDSYAATSQEVTPGDYVQLAVTDTGTGMSRTVSDRALEPFFTTKPVGQGSGLGLSMVYGFVKQSGGHIKIYSELGRGTTIKLFLPSAHPELASPDEEVTAVSPRSRGETVLVVEDDEAVRHLTVRQLQVLGYRTLEAEDGRSALAQLERTERVDLLFSDVVLPNGQSGPMLARAVTAMRPDMKVLYMSGYTRDAVIHNGVLDPGVRLLTKPFRRDELACMVREALDEEPSP
jgi:PAS domain S-box-containing protein